LKKRCRADQTEVIRTAVNIIGEHAVYKLHALIVLVVGLVIFFLKFDFFATIYLSIFEILNFQ